MHGLRGEVSVVPLGDEPGRMAAGCELFFEKAGAGPRLLRVASSRSQPKRLLLRFEGFETREEATSLIGGDLSVPFDPGRLAPGQYYPHQLEGLEVRTIGGESVGRVAGVVFGPGAELLEVRREGRQAPLLIPFHGDIVSHVDLAGGTLAIDPPEGLLDL